MTSLINVLHDGVIRYSDTLNVILALVAVVQWLGQRRSSNNSLHQLTSIKEMSERLGTLSKEIAIIEKSRDLVSNIQAMEKQLSQSRWKKFLRGMAQFVSFFSK